VKNRWFLGPVAGFILAIGLFLNSYFTKKSHFKSDTISSHSPQADQPQWSSEKESKSQKGEDIEFKFKKVFQLSQDKKNRILFFQELEKFCKEYGVDSLSFVRAFLTDSEWDVRCAAIRAMALTDTIEAKEILNGFIQDGLPIEDAAQATIAMGGMSSPDVTRVLLGKLNGVIGKELRGCLLDTLTERPYEQTSVFFAGYLAAQNVPEEEKGRVIAGLGFHQTAPVELIVPFVTNESEEIRMGAYQALAARTDATYGQVMMARLQVEQDPAVRQMVYEAAGAQQDTLPYQLSAASAQETNPETKLRAERAWGMTVGRSQNSEDQRAFGVQAVPALVQEALQNPDPGEQRAALQALAFSRTDAARSALVKISQETTSPRLSNLASDLATQITPRSKN
jgi:HEAT repeat protein